MGEPIDHEFVDPAMSIQSLAFQRYVMDEPTIIVEIRGGPRDGERMTLGLPAARPDFTSDLTVFGVPLHLVEPGRYYVEWSDIKGWPASLLVRMLDEAG